MSIAAYLRLSTGQQSVDQQHRRGSSALASDAGGHREAARLFGAAHGIRQRMGAVRFKVYDAGYEASAAALHNTMGDNDFDAAWVDGASLSTEEAIANAQRGRGERKRHTSGWPPCSIP